MSKWGNRLGDITEDKKQLALEILDWNYQETKKKNFPNYEGSYEIEWVDESTAQWVAEVPDDLCITKAIEKELG